MYIFGYHYNQSYYDVYDYDWENRDPWGDTTNPFVIPLGWNLNEKSIAPIGADRSPPWHQISVSERRYNNKFPAPNTSPSWERNPQNESLGGDRINLYNTGLPITWAISETHLASTKHYVAYSVDRINYDTWHFMNPSGRIFRVTIKDISDMKRADGGVGFNHPNEISVPRIDIPGTDESYDSDLTILEIDEIREITWNGVTWIDGELFNTMTEIGCPPLTKYGRWDNAPLTKYPIWTLDRQGRCLISYNNGSSTVTQPVQRRLFLDLGNGTDKVTGNAEYFTAYTGDSGTPAFVNTEEHGFLFCRALWGGYGLNQDMQNFIENTFDIEMPEIEYIDLNTVTLIDYWENPDIDYRNSDDDDETFLPVIPNQSTKVEMTFTDEEGNNLDYTSSTENVDITIDNFSILRENTFQDDCTIGKFELGDVDPPYTIFTDSPNHRIDDSPAPMFLSYTDNITSYKRPSSDISELVEVEYFVDGVNRTADFIAGGFPQTGMNIFNYRRNDANEYVISGGGSYREIPGSVLSGYEVGVPVSFHVNLKLLSDPPQQKLITLGTLTKSRPPEGVNLSYDTSELYQDNEVTFSLQSTNVPVPEINFQEEAFLLLNLVNCTLVSSTTDTFTIRVDGEEGETVSFTAYYYWAINDTVPISSNLPVFTPISVSEEIIQSPLISASLIVNPDVDNDGFADTYSYKIQLETQPEGSEPENYEWIITFPDIIE